MYEGAKSLHFSNGGSSEEEWPKRSLKMPSNGVFIAVGEPLGRPVRDGVRGTRSGKVGVRIALRTGQDLRMYQQMQGSVCGHGIGS